MVCLRGFMPQHTHSNPLLCLRAIQPSLLDRDTDRSWIMAHSETAQIREVWPTLPQHYSNADLGSAGMPPPLSEQYGPKPARNCSGNRTNIQSACPKNCQIPSVKQYPATCPGRAAPPD